MFVPRGIENAERRCVCVCACMWAQRREKKAARWSDKTTEYISHQNKNIDLNLI